MYSHGLDIPTIPSDSCFNVPSASELRQVEAAYTPIDALPGAISAGDLSRLGPIPQVRMISIFFCLELFKHFVASRLLLLVRYYEGEW
jgi:hypothetical protein